jgi:hypothetical protein
MPLKLQTPWVSEALYRMWASGVRLVTRFLLQDQPLATSPYQSGLYFLNGQPKPALMPADRRGTAVIEQQSAGTWKRLGVVKTNASGIFTGRFTSEGGGPLRARLAAAIDDVSQPFSLVEPRDVSVRPVGEG